MRPKLLVVFGLMMIVSAFPFRPVVAVDLQFDTDGDGLSDGDEVSIYHTNPTVADTDGDGYSDGEEIMNGYSPLVGNKKKLNEVDSDSDGLSDKLELALGTDLMNPDTDGDGHKDGEEAYAGFNPLKGDNDRSLPRHVEVDLTNQQLYYFLNNVKLGSIPVSTGVFGKLTPVGTFAVYKKVPVIHYKGPGYDLPNTKWNLGFKPSYYLHGAYWHNQFGIRPMSHGCVNIAYKDVEKLYAFMDVGDKVVISGKTPKRVSKPITESTTVL
jgi:hypothetical protein